MGSWCCQVAKHPAINLFSPMAPTFIQKLLTEMQKKKNAIYTTEKEPVSVCQIIAFLPLMCLKLAMEQKPGSAARNFKCMPMSLFEKVIAQCGRTDGLIQ